MGIREWWSGQRPGWIEYDLYDLMRQRAHDAERKEWEMAFKMVVGEPITVFGMRIEVSWPDGQPFDREYAQRKLWELREKKP
jgi:hypothetical protein